VLLQNSDTIREYKIQQARTLWPSVIH